MIKNKEEYAKSVCYFLAEELRVQRVSLPRAAEIAQKVVDNLNLIDTEQDFLRLILDLSKDFEELHKLHERIRFDIDTSNRRGLEEEVREFVVNILPRDTDLALRILKEAVKDDIKDEDLSHDFPEFKVFLEKNKK